MAEARAPVYNAQEALPFFVDIRRTDIPLAFSKATLHFKRVLELCAAELANVCESPHAVQTEVTRATAALLFQFLVHNYWTISALHTSGPERGESLAGLVFLCYCYCMEILRIGGDQRPEKRATDYSVARRCLLATFHHPIAHYSQKEAIVAWRAVSNRYLALPDPFDAEAWTELFEYLQQLTFVTVSIVLGAEEAVRYAPHAPHTEPAAGAAPLEDDYDDDELSDNCPCIGVGHIDMPSSKGTAFYTRLDAEAGTVRVSSKYIAEIMHCLVPTVAVHTAVQKIYKRAATEEDAARDPLSSEELDTPRADIERLLLSIMNIPDATQRLCTGDGVFYSQWIEEMRKEMHAALRRRVSPEGAQELRLRLLTEATPPHLGVRYVFEKLFVSTSDRSRFSKHFRSMMADTWLFRKSNKATALDMLSEDTGYLDDFQTRAAFEAATFFGTLIEEGVEPFDFLSAAASFGYRGVYRDAMPSVAFYADSSASGARVNIAFQPETKAVFSTAAAGAVQLTIRWRQPPLYERAGPCLLFYCGTSACVLLSYCGVIRRFSTAFEAALCWLLIVLEYGRGQFRNDDDAPAVDFNPCRPLIARTMLAAKEAVGDRLHPAVAAAIESACKDVLQRYTLADVLTGDGTRLVCEEKALSRFLIPAFSDKW